MPNRMQDELSLYNTFREYVRHEDGLVHNRLQWILTIHGFLYTTYGLTIQKQLEITSNISINYEKLVPQTLDLIINSYHQTVLFLYVISSVGLLISFFGLLSINSASSAVKNIGRIYRTQKTAKAFNYNELASAQPSEDIPLNQWRGRIRYVMSNEGTEYYLPTINGGGSLVGAKTGNIASTLIPIILMASWTIALYNNSYTSHKMINLEKVARKELNVTSK